MTYHYEFMEDVALADAAFRVKADSWSELFTGAAMAVTRIMVDPTTISATRQKTVTLTQETVEDLLYSWLAEIVYLKDAEQLLLTSVEVDVLDTPTWSLSATLHGDTIDLSRAGLGQDVKAVTYHLFKVWQSGPECQAQVVLDI